MNNRQTYQCIICGILTVCFLIFPLNTSPAKYGDSSEHRIAKTIRIDGKPPNLDGVLDDEIWKNAPLHDGFMQREPDEGKPSSERTTFKVVYDDEAIYFGIMCYDSEPDKIDTQIIRRDNVFVDLDKININIDSHNNRQQAYWFTVHPSGSVTDGIISDNMQPDNTWDGVWDVKTKIHPNGWGVEYKIPFHVLRFSPKEEYTWGLQVNRYIRRNKEDAHWRLIKKDEPGWVSRLGDLEGIKNIRPSQHLEFLPYAMSKSTLNSGIALWGNVGTDIQYGITTGTSLSATINPDFGQVEADPARLNLSAYEEFFEERRPFFVEGSSIFQANGNAFFYSRRIGRRPSHFAIPDDAEELNRSESTTILGATKIIGSTQGGTTFGIMQAITAPEYAQIRLMDKTSEYLVEPLTNYFVGRINQDVLKGSSRVGLITTAVNRQNSNSAYVTGFDWDLKLAKERYIIGGTVAGSQTGKHDARQSGYLTHLKVGKRGGWIGFNTSIKTFSPNFEINDIGYIQRSDKIELQYDLSIRKNTPISIFRDFNFGIFGWRNWNYDGVNISSYMELWTNGRFKNYWNYNLWIGRSLAAFSDEDVWRGGTLIKTPPGWWVFSRLATDSRKIVQLEINPIISWNDNWTSHSYYVKSNIRIRLGSNIELSLGPSYNYQIRDAQWVDVIEENIDGDIRKHYIYGELKSQTLDFTTRANISFTPTLSLQFYVQPFITIGNYIDFKELVEPKSYLFKPYSLNENRDFHNRSLRGNTVLRWEFHPGSTLFFVWSQTRNTSIESVGETDLELRPFNRLLSSFTDEGENILLIKCQYWFGM